MILVMGDSRLDRASMISHAYSIRSRDVRTGVYTYHTLIISVTRTLLRLLIVYGLCCAGTHALHPH